MNKYQEALDDISCKLISTDIECHICKDIRNRKCEFDYEKTILTLQELIDKEEKYRWHDLRKDPNDLPNIGEKVLCATGNKGGREVQIYRGSRLNSRNESVWEWKHNSLKCPIAWKYIEEFEDE